MWLLAGPLAPNYQRSSERSRGGSLWLHRGQRAQPFGLGRLAQLAIEGRERHQRYAGCLG
jgi:hypothetical protein